MIPQGMRPATLAALAFAFSSALAQAEETQTPAKTPITPLPSLNRVEECQRGDLSRSYGKVVRFHHGACWVDVSIDENGKITSFLAEDEAVCRKALLEN